MSDKQPKLTGYSASFKCCDDQDPLTKSGHFPRGIVCVFDERYGGGKIIEPCPICGKMYEFIITVQVYELERKNHER